jgi:cytoskeletal protein RodZ
MDPAHDLGARIRAAREARGLTISDIAAVTRISTRALAAIEHEAFDALPAGIFRRGWIRAYADAVGLDGQALARDYVARFEPPPPEPAAPPRWRWSPPLLLGGVAVIGAILVAAGAALSWRESRRADEGGPEPAAAGVTITVGAGEDEPPAPGVEAL